MAGLDGLVGRPDDEGVDTGADAGERAAAVARMEGYTKADWTVLHGLAANGEMPGVDREALLRRSELQWPGISGRIRADYASASKVILAHHLVASHGASARSLGADPGRFPKAVMVDRLVDADLCWMAFESSVEQTTGVLWTPSAEDVRRHGGR